jgi:SAM-dependent methyltransferase
MIHRNDIINTPSRLRFFLDHYKDGEILDVGNIGGLNGEGGGINIRPHVSGTITGFDSEAPKEPEKYPNQYTGNIEHCLPFIDNEFDTVYMGEIIEHLTSVKYALDEIRRVLKPDGVLILDTPNAYYWRSMVRALLGRDTVGNPTHTIIFTPDSLRATLERCGFVIDAYGMKGGWLGSHLLIAARKI